MPAYGLQNSLHLPVPAHRINLPHDPLGPLDARLDELVRARASLWRPEKVIRRLHVQARENRCHDSEHALSTFVHEINLALSLFIR